MHLNSETKRNVWYGMVCMMDIEVCVVTETRLREGSSDGCMNMIGDEFEWFSRERKNQNARSGGWGRYTV